MSGGPAGGKAPPAADVPARDPPAGSNLDAPVRADEPGAQLPEQGLPEQGLPEQDLPEQDLPEQDLAETVEGEAVSPSPRPTPLEVSAICHRCGGGKRGPFVPCKSCSYTPAALERQVAWLFSEHHLGAEELSEAARRIRAGERPEPSRALLEQARIRMGAAPLTTDARRPLSAGQLVAILVANVALTPLVGFALWWGLHQDRPVAARQALRLTVPVAALAGLLWLLLMGRWTLG